MGSATSRSPRRALLRIPPRNHLDRLGRGPDLVESGDWHQREARGLAAGEFASPPRERVGVQAMGAGVVDAGLAGLAPRRDEIAPLVTGTSGTEHAGTSRTILPRSSSPEKRNSDGPMQSLRCSPSN